MFRTVARRYTVQLPTYLDQLNREHLAASDDERELWARVKGRHPGQPGHDAVAWREWLAAARRVQALARAIRELKPAG